MTWTRAASTAVLLAIAVAASLSSPAPAAAAPADDYRAAMARFERGDFAVAADSLSAFVRRHPEDALCRDARFWRSEALQRAGRYAEAAAAYTMALAGETGARRVAILLGRAAARRGLGAARIASDDYRAAAGLLSGGARAEALAAAARSLLEVGDTPLAVPLLSEAADDAPETLAVWAHVERARALLGHETAAAAAAFESAAARSSDATWAARAWANAAGARDAAGESIAAIDGLRLAGAALRRGAGETPPVTVAEAAAALARACRRDTGFVPSAVRFATLLLEVSGDSDASLAALEGVPGVPAASLRLAVLRLRAADPSDPGRSVATEGIARAASALALLLPPGLERAEANRIAADAYLEIDRSAEAAEAYLRVAEEAETALARRAAWNAALLFARRDPRRVEARILPLIERRAAADGPAVRLLLGDLAIGRGDLDLARRHYERSAPGAGRDEAARADLGLGVIAEARADTEEAIGRFAAAAEARDDTVARSAAERLGRLLVAAGRSSEAADALSGLRAPAARRMRAQALADAGRHVEAAEVFAALAVEAPGPGDLRDLASSALAADRPETAVAALRRLVEEHPDAADTPQALLDLGRALDALGRRSEARDALRAALATDLPRIGRREALRIDARLALSEGAHAEAAERYGQLVAAGGRDSEALFGAGLAHLGAGRPDRAAEYLDALLVEAPTTPHRRRAVVALAQAHLALGQAAAAAPLLQEIAADTGAHLLLLDWAAERSAAADTAAAFAAYDAVAGRAVPTVRRSALLGRARANLHLQRYAEAAADVEGSLDLGASGGDVDALLVTAAERIPDDARALGIIARLSAGADTSLRARAAYRRGDVLRSRGGIADAAEAYREALALGLTDRRAVARAATAVAEAAEAAGRWAEAAGRYEAAVRSGGLTDPAPVRIAWGRALRRAGGPAEAVGALRPVARSSGPSGGLAALEMGFALLDLGRPAEAEATFAAPAARTADEARALYGLALARASLGDVVGARRHLLALTLRYPDAPFADEAVWRLAAAEERAGDAAEALTDLRTLVERYPESARRAEAEAAIRRLEEL